MDSRKADIYFCCSKKEQELASGTAEILESSGVSCFLVWRDMDYTKDWDAQIEQAMKASCICVYLEPDQPSPRILDEVRQIEGCNTRLMTFSPASVSAEEIAAAVSSGLEEARAEKELRSRIYPYDGEDPFIFASYSHMDKDTVFEIIRGFQKHGYRVWFDEGIDPGTEWDEYIATHIDACSYLMAFLSENYYGSDNCRDELFFAREVGKPLLMIYIKNDELPAGMKLRFNRIQAIHWYTYKDIEEFFEKVASAAGIEECREEGES
ncbi:MAG: toll/interleukin-1 receptor domain-containing protein [Oscillospiraceae bacterium]|nr:toll/interleukin-1 receptor domain-containing protein [Oscillospiraceae bacterium]